MSQTPNGGTLLRRVDSRGESQQHRHKHNRSERITSGDYPRSRHTSHSETPTQHVHYPQSSSSMMPSRHEEQIRPASVASQRRLQRIVQATQPSPAPPSYDRARAYVPPPLPPGYKVSLKNFYSSETSNLATTLTAIWLSTNFTALTTTTATRKYPTFSSACTACYTKLSKYIAAK